VEQKDVDGFVERLKERIDVLYVDRRGRNASVRCPYCGDSQKNPMSAHLNIRLKNPEFLIWRCVRCEAKGAVSPDFVRDLRCFDDGALRMAHANLSRARKKFRPKTGGGFHRLKLPIHLDRDACRRLGYVEDRLGISIPPSKAGLNYSIIADIGWFIKVNGLKLEEEPKTIKRLAREGIGFLSSDHSQLAIRDTTGNWKKRYYACMLYGEDPFSNSLFAVPKEVEAMTERVILVMTEGAMDLLGVSYHILPDLAERRDVIFAAAGGKYFASALKAVRTRGFLNLDVRFYADAEVGLPFFRWLKREDSLLKHEKIEVNYNSIGKDFGMKREEIKLRRAIV